MGIPERLSDYHVVTATIAESGNLSGEVDIEGLILVGISMPAAWTAAAITFQGSPDDGSTYQNVYDLAGEKTISSSVAIASAMIIFGPSEFIGIGRKLKIRSGTSGTPVSQVAARTLTLVLTEV